MFGIIVHYSSWSERLDSNQRPRGPEPRALPTELRPVAADRTEHEDQAPYLNT